MNEIKSDNINELSQSAFKALDQKDFKKGKLLLEKINVINPNLPDVNNNLGLLNFQENNIEKSIEFFDKAIKLNPNFSAAFCNLGIAYTKLNKFEFAETNLKNAIKLNKKNFTAVYNLGNLYKIRGDLENAEKYLNESIVLNPNLIVAYNNLFELYDKSNQLKKLNSITNKAKVYLKNNPISEFFSGLNEYKKKNYDEVIKIFKKIELNKNDLTRNQIKNEILAKSFDHIGQFEKAFYHFQLANNLAQIKDNNVSDKKKFIYLIQKRLTYFSSKNFNKWNNIDIDNLDSDPIFLVGFPRSGTTLLDTILRTSPSIEVIEEKPIVNLFIKKLEEKIKINFDNLEKLDLDYVNEMRSTYFKYRQKYINSDSKKIYIDKMPFNLIHIGEITRFFPNAKFILSLRKPHDVILSCYMQQFSLNDAMAHFTNIEDAANLYDLTMNLLEKYLELFKKNIFIIKYEDVVNDFDNNIKKLLNFLGVEWNNELRNFHKTASNRGMISTPSYNQVSQPLYNKSINRWKNYEKQFIKSQDLLNKWAKKFNY